MDHKSSHNWYAVRCCCTPQKVFGFLRLPVSVVDNGPFITVAEVRTGKGTKTKWKTHRICLRHIAMLYGHQMELAIYSDDRPIEFWRRIEGFMEVSDG